MIKLFEYMILCVKGFLRRLVMLIILYSVKVRMSSGSYVMYVKVMMMMFVVVNIYKKSIMLIKCFNEYGVFVFFVWV